MIKKITKIRNVARFHNYSPSGNVAFNQLTLIYSENGKGKSTLSTVLQSLAEDNPYLIMERKTISGTGDQEIEILLDSSSRTFKDNRWNSPLEDLIVFNSNFIHNNVYSGQTIDAEHRKNNATFVLGEKGMQLVNDIDALDRSGRETAGEIKKVVDDIQAKNLSKYKLESFLAIAQVENIEELISEQKKLINRVERGKEIASQPGLKRIPDFPNATVEHLLNFLNSSIETIHLEAERKTKEHIEKHFGLHDQHHSVEWLEQGLKYLKDNQCPFCSQTITGLDLIDAYKQYFTTEYISHSQILQENGAALFRNFTNQNLKKVQESLNETARLIYYWKSHGVAFEVELPNTEEIIEPWKYLSAELPKVKEAKIKQMALPLSPSDELIKILGLFEKVEKTIETFNDNCAALNKLIDEKKREYLSADIAMANRKLLELETIAIRYSSDALSLIEKYERLVKAKRNLEISKDLVKGTLDSYSKSIFVTYEEQINRFLEHCGAGYSIIETATTYAGGKASSQYRLKINGESIELNESEGAGEPCFKNTLSEGDKNTLAYAFFVAKMLIDQGLPNKVIVIDDPIASLDIHRQECTKDSIIELAKTAKQVIVLSHLPHFLASIKESWSEKPTQDLQISTTTYNGFPSSNILSWDLYGTVQSSYFKMYKNLFDYYNDVSSGDKEMMVMLIRRLLEGYLRRRFPMILNKGQGLGDFIKTIKESDADSPLVAMKMFVPELDKINEFSKTYHHGGNSSGRPMVELTDNTLQPWVRRTLKVIYGSLERETPA